MLIFSLAMISVILLCILANNLLLGPFYTRHKEKVLNEAYRLIDGYSQKGGLDSEEFGVGLDQVAARYNLDIIVLDADTNTLRTTVNDPKFLTDRLLGYIFSGPAGNVLYSNDEYTVMKAVDPRMHTEYIELWGYLSGSRPVLMRSPVESIETSVHIANRLLAYVGAAVLVIGLLINLLLSRKVTDPILELVDISRKMTELDFDVKYKSGGSNEIALLGDHMNRLSTTLEGTISELKTANASLKVELERKAEVEKMRREFVSNASHELKTPIALIQGYAEGLKDCVNSDAESRDFYCDVIIDEAGKMNRLVRSMIELNQLESGEDDLSMERFDITALIRGCASAADILIKQAGIEIVLPGTEEPVYVWADELKVEQVVNNYLSNAIHYCSNDKKIEISLSRGEGSVRISVFNTGDPIPEESIPLLWTKFYKVDKARTREYGGSGIGLSIVKAVMDSMGRGYGVINREDGVEFWFELDAAS